MLPLLMAAAGSPSVQAFGTKVLSSIHIGHPNKDPEREAADDAAFEKAKAGDANALLFLRQRSGKFGIVDVPGYGQVGGWADAKMQDDAWAKYQNIVAGLPLPATMPSDPASWQAVVNATWAKVRGDVADGAQMLLTGATNQVTSAIGGDTSRVSVPLAMPSAQTMLLIGAAVALVLILRRA